MPKYLVQSVEVCKKKDGAPYRKVKLFEAGGKQHEAMLWDDIEVEAGTVVDALTVAGEYKGAPQLTIKQLRIDPSPSAVDEFLPHSPKDVTEMYTHLCAFVAMVKDPHIKLLLERAIADPRWKRAPAAKMMHHNYLGGLLEHVVGLCRLSHAVSLLYDPIVNCDFLVAASILHDIGKMSEMECGANIQNTISGDLLGHISQGFQTVSNMMDKFGTPSKDENGASTGIRLRIEHMLLSHHGKKEFGSPVTPKTVEAQMFFMMDDMDARMGAIAAEVAKSTGKPWTEKIGYCNFERLYLGDSPEPF